MDFSFITNPVRPELPDPVADYTRGMSLAQLARQNRMGVEEERYKALDRQSNTLASQGLARAQQTGDPKTTLMELSQQGEAGALAAQKLMKHLRDESESQAKVAHQNAQTDELKAKAGGERSKSRIDSLKTFANIAGGIASGSVPVNDNTAGALYESAIALNTPPELLRTLPTSTEGIRQWSAMMANAAVDPEKQAQIWKIQMETPANVAEKEAQARLHGVQADIAPQDARSRAITAGAAATNAATTRAQYTNPNMQHVSDGQGGMYAFNPRGGGFAAATGPGGQPLPRTDKPLTETQGNATAFGMRMRDAAKTIAGLEQGDKVDPTGVLVAMSGNRGWTGPAQNIIAGKANPQATVYKQAQRNWVTANLRKESGAAIPEEELQSEFVKWFPQIGDPPELVRAKAEARKVAERAMVVQAGPGAKNIPDEAPSREAGGRIKQAASLPDPASLPDGAIVTDTNSGEKLYVRGGKYMLRP